MFYHTWKVLPKNTKTRRLARSTFAKRLEEITQQAKEKLGFPKPCRSGTLREQPNLRIFLFLGKTFQVLG
jgi:hypothetical protein